jgi:6-phosphogluconolactonase (cycloisomerase 2 family)
MTLLLVGALMSLLIPGVAWAGGSAYVGDWGSTLGGEGVSQFDLGEAGKLSPKSPATIASAGETKAVAVTPDGRTLYAADLRVHAISQYSVDPLTGQLTPKSPRDITTGAGVVDLAITPNGKSVYAVARDEGLVFQYDIATGGGLSQKAPATVPTGSGPMGVAVSPDGRSAYVTSFIGSDVFQYDIDQASGDLIAKTPATSTPGGAFAATGIAVTPDGKSVYVTSNRGESCCVYEFDAEALTGDLTAKTPSKIEKVGPSERIAVTPDGKSAYASNGTQFDVDPITGVLTDKAPEGFTVGSNPRGIAVSGDGRHAYVVQGCSTPEAEKGRCNVGSVAQYDISATNGDLTQKIPPEANAGASPYGIALLSPAPATVTEVSPREGPEAGGTSVTITGTNFSAVSAVRFGSTEAASFTVSQSATSITAVAPPGSDAVDVTVTTPAGASATGFPDQFSYFFVPPPTVTEASPSEGPLGGATTVTVAGSNFREVSAVKFGSANAKAFKVNSEHSITAESPAGSGTVDVTVTTPGGTSATSSVDQFTYVPPPTVASVTPTEGPEGAGTSVTITGTSFRQVGSIKFGSAAATSFTVNSETSITAEAPAGSGVVDVVVTTQFGTSTVSSGDKYSYRPVPTVASIDPSAGQETGGTSVTIVGSGFTASSSVRFGPSSAESVKVDSETSITAVSPAGAGTVDVTVSTAGGTSATSSADQFSYLPPPTVTSVVPGEGPQGGGTSVTITGTSFTAGSAVKFGTSNASSIKVNSATAITATSPPGSGTVDVTVATPGGSSATGSADRFSYVPPPSVTSLNPTEGPVAGGTSVSLSGANLLGASAVRFGSTSASSYTVNSATSITAIAPAQGAGPVDVTVTTVGGTSGTGAGDRFSYLPPPTITRVEPNDGPASGGTTVTLTGTNLVGASGVKFGGSSASSFTVNSASSITAGSPAGSGGIVDVTVTTAGGTSATGATDRFVYLQAPEYGRCIAVTAGTGKYENSGCSKPGGTKKFEWYPAVGGPRPLAKTHFKAQSKEATTPVLETTTKTRIVCKGETSAGEYASDKTTAVQIRFTGCEGPGGKCTTAGSAEGEITTNALVGALGVVLVSKEGPLKNKIGSDLKAAGGGLIAEFTCGGTPAKLRGAAIVEVKANAMSATATLKYAAIKGIQKPTHFEGLANEILETSFGTGPFEQTGLALTTIQTSDEKVEVNSVI